MEVKLLNLDVPELFEKHRERQPNDCHPWWDCEPFPPEPEEIRNAIEHGNLHAECNDLNQRLEDREWHIGRIAYLMKHNISDPIEMKRPWSRMEIQNGAHRLLAAHYLDKKTILAFEGAVEASQPR